MKVVAATLAILFAGSSAAFGGQPPAPTAPGTSSGVTTTVITPTTTNNEQRNTATVSPSGAAVFSPSYYEMRSDAEVRLGDCEYGVPTLSVQAGLDGTNYRSGQYRARTSSNGANVSFTMPFAGKGKALCQEMYRLQMTSLEVRTERERSAMKGEMFALCAKALTTPGWTLEMVPGWLRPYCPTGAPVVQVSPPAPASTPTPSEPKKVIIERDREPDSPTQKVKNPSG